MIPRKKASRETTSLNPVLPVYSSLEVLIVATNWLTFFPAYASTNMDIPATPAAPASSASRKLDCFIPPSAMTGMCERAETSRNASIPTGSPYCALLAVSKMGPNTMKSAPPLFAASASASL